MTKRKPSSNEDIVKAQPKGLFGKRLGNHQALDKEKKGFTYRAITHSELETIRGLARNNEIVDARTTFRFGVVGFVNLEDADGNPMVVKTETIRAPTGENLELMVSDQANLFPWNVVNEVAGKIIQISELTPNVDKTGKIRLRFT